MKMSLLDIVQDILSDMSSDEVNSIDDTPESLQVAQIVKATYYALISNRNWPHTKKLVALTPSGDNLLPTHMSVPSAVKEMVLINYDTARIGDTRKLYKEVKWLNNDEFLFFLNARNSSSSNFKVVTDPSGIELIIQKDKAPTYYTSFDDETVVFDSYDENMDSTLQADKIQAIAYVIPEWSHTDSFIPDLPAEAFPALLEEAKSRAMFKLKEVQDIKAEQEAGRQQRWLSRKAWTVKGGIQYPSYGRGRVK